MLSQKRLTGKPLQVVTSPGSSWTGDSNTGMYIAGEHQNELSKLYDFCALNKLA
jgi:hypothetical protein